ncbi:energy transducer TonB family protein [Ancylobacter amanitiformis]|uniref:Protein TonB n=1 Tax=Ancylobacter amanitiformis TaxID=217069 RepID=A0ABU0LMC4_9HYPH|nr:energy transducer TonB [Ancylobacter amanitiformis]MDQ0509805.1 protein TonB [Ancylobacter amanitiformis]
MSLMLLKGGPRQRGVEVLVWTVCGALVLGVHGAAVAYMLQQPPLVAADEPAAIMIELAELPVSPEAEPVELPPGPQMVEAPEKIEQEVPPDPLSEVEDVPPPEPEIEQEPIPEVAQSPAPDIEVPLPPPPPLAAELTPPEKKPDPPKERPKPKPKPKEREKSEKPPAPQTSAAPSIDAARADRVAAPTAGAASSRSMTAANWRSRLMAHLNRHKRYPAGENGSGKARVAFTIDRSGRVLAVRLIGGSGNGSFDEEAVAMVRRASPVPPPPADIGGSTIRFSVPVDFTRR